MHILDEATGSYLNNNTKANILYLHYISFHFLLIGATTSHTLVLIVKSRKYPFVHVDPTISISCVYDFVSALGPIVQVSPFGTRQFRALSPHGEAQQWCEECRNDS